MHVLLLVLAFLALAGALGVLAATAWDTFR